MVLEDILKGMQRCNQIELLPDAHASLSIPKNVFYIQTNYVEIKVNEKSRVNIVSAPGASGKSTLAKYLVSRFGGIYWDLSQIAIGENTFQGTLWKALKQSKLFEFWNNLAIGKGVLSLDTIIDVSVHMSQDLAHRG